MFAALDPVRLELNLELSCQHGLSPALLSEPRPRTSVCGLGLPFVLLFMVLHAAVASVMFLGVFSVPTPPETLFVSLLPPMQITGAGDLNEPIFAVAAQKSFSEKLAPLPQVMEPPKPAPRIEPPQPASIVKKAQPEPVVSEPKKLVEIPSKKVVAKESPKPEPFTPSVPKEAAGNVPVQGQAADQASSMPLAEVSTATSTRGSGRRVGAGGDEVSSGPVQAKFGEVNGPSFVRRVMPKYPAMARRKGWEGLVVLRLTIGADGKLKEVEVVEGGGRGFEDAALAAVKASTYAPATREGKSVECSALLPLRFTLKNS